MSGPTIANVADGDAHVAVQIGVLHVDGDYCLPPEASPEETFRAGVRFLDARIPDEARNLIEEAAARGYEATDEAHFFRLLALLSGRTLSQLDAGELDHLESICHQIDRADGADVWAAGLRAVLTLFESPESTDPDLAVKQIEELPPRQRDLILDHLGVLRSGPTEDRMWQLSVERARAAQLSADRTDRVWIFFQPYPAPPRVRPAKPFSVAPAEWLRAILGGAAFLFSVAAIGRLILKHGEVSPILAYLVAVAGVVTFAIQGAEWHCRRRRVRAKDAELIARPRDQSAPHDGFARRIDRLFDDYFGRYVPRDTDRSLWLQQTAGIRQNLRDEVVEIYREQRIKADQLAWLVRHLVAGVRHRWEKQTLTAHRTQLRTPAWVVARCLLGLVAVVAGCYWIVPAAVGVAPFAGTAYALLAVVSAGAAAVGGFRIHAERRRVRADDNERSSEQLARDDAYARWMQKLSRKPTDAEMAGWLECDRRILVDETMRHYRLKASQVIAHAFIEAPGPSAKKGRIRRGPWRYSRYQMLLFLLTDDGVRQVDVALDFEKVSAQRTQRLNYRFDTVAAVRIDGPPAQRQTFELTLFNGPPVRVQVTEPVVENAAAGEDAWTLSRVALDASGLPRTLEIMEGIAAEGKEWIRRRHGRAAKRLTELSETIHDLIE